MISRRIVLFLAAWLISHLVEGSRFALYLDTANWEDAKYNCELQGRRFAHIDSAEDQAEVEKLSYYIDGFFWIGLKGNSSSSQTFLWSDQSVANYTHWATGFPGHEEGLDCTRIRDFDFRWETHDCSLQLNYLCEDTKYIKSSPVSTKTKITGVMMGLGIIGGILLVSCLLLQLTSFRDKISDKMADIGFGTNSLDKKIILEDPVLISD